VESFLLSGMAKPTRLPNRDEQSTLDHLQVRLITGRERRRWNRLVREHHYLKNADLVGEQLRYVVTDAQGHWLALLGWNAAAWHLKARDAWIGWSEEQRERRLALIAQNSRFVILADRQQLPNLASRALALCAAHLSQDWQSHYHHPIVLLESFVDRQLFRGTAYKSAGWQALGATAGYARVMEDFYERHERPKELWVRALDRRAPAWLRAPTLPPSLVDYEKPLPPRCVVASEQLPSLYERFGQLKEWRAPNGKRHRLPVVMAIIAAACLSGVGQGYRAIARFAQRLTQPQRRQLRCWIHPDTGKYEVPSEAVFQRVLAKVDRQEVARLALQWQDDLLGPLPASETVVLDGKEVRGGDVMLVGAAAQPSQRVLGVEPVESQTNEIPTARQLLARLPLTGRLVQADGMHTQHETVAQVLYEGGADYSCILRDNQPTLLKTAQTLLPESVPPCASVRQSQ
jgi:hypothetical protein